ncbi:signal-regulatory protein beta-1 [Orycteropus afer afer]|uniref:Signal-regulatory protein beta-1 n=1 Tax=Orycteropus afer afer TaxID=1230840 RepID=A0A8B7BF15_ORYAF|nr:signal-regulatory protein beta-1 [Orycteropus afer afer]
MPTSAAQPCLSLPSLLLPLLLGLTGVTGEELTVTQPKRVLATAGEAVTLPCVMSSLQPLGPTQWFRGTGPNRQLVYSFKGGLDPIRLFPRVRNVTDSTKRGNLDFSIRIINITLADDDTYFCVKFTKGSPDDVEFKSGVGTQVTVSTKPSAIMLLGPTARTTPGQTVNFTCESHGFFPRDVTLKWFKNGNELPALQTKVVPPGNSISYNISSRTQVLLTPEDVHSKIICVVAHITLRDSLLATANLSEIIRVPPTLELTRFPVEGNQVNITCQVKKFYPKSLQLTWLENGSVSQIDSALIPIEDRDGTYSLKSWTLVNSSAYKEDMLTCQVVHDGQPAVSINKAQKVTTPLKDQGTESTSGPCLELWTPLLLFGGLLLGLKVLLVVGVSVIYVYRKQRA